MRFETNLPFFRRFAPRAAVLALSLLAAACGDADGDREDHDQTQTKKEDCTEELVGPVDPTLVVDDFEDADSMVAAVGARDGAWWLATDMSGGTVTPPGDQAALPERILGGGRCGSKYAMRISGEGFTDWGITLVANLRYGADGLAPVDVTGLRGMMFWGRVGEGNAGALRVQFQDGNTYPEGGVCSAGSDGDDACYNGFGTEIVPLDEKWRLYKLDFSRMSQRDFGLRTGALDLARLYSIDFTVGQNTVFDFWVDDVFFYE